MGKNCAGWAVVLVMPIWISGHGLTQHVSHGREGMNPEAGEKNTGAMIVQRRILQEQPLHHLDPYIQSSETNLICVSKLGSYNEVPVY